VQDGPRDAHRLADGRENFPPHLNTRGVSMQTPKPSLKSDSTLGRVSLRYREISEACVRASTLPRNLRNGFTGGGLGEGE
jgi:hypothetical protein